MRKGTIVALLVVAGAGAGGYYAWDRGIIGNNPRAPTEKAMLTALRTLFRSGEPFPCVGVYGVPPAEVRGTPGIGPRMYPGQHRDVYFVDYAERQSSRDVQLAQLRHLAQHKLFAEADTQVETDRGMRPAKEYRLTWEGLVQDAGFGQSGGPCFRVGNRSVGRVTRMERLSETVRGLQVWQVGFESVLADPPAWVTHPDAARLFPSLQKQLQPVTVSAKLVRGTNGWQSDFDAQAEAMIETKGESYRALFRKDPPLTDAEGKALVTKSMADVSSMPTECLRVSLQPLPYQTPPLGMTYNVTFNDAPPQSDADKVFASLHVWAALELAGLATREEVDPRSSKDPGARSGVRWHLTPEGFVALGMDKKRECIPLGKSNIEVLSVTQTREDTARVIARGQLVEVQDWVRRLSAHMPALKSVLDNGVPYMGSVNLQAGAPGTFQKVWVAGKLSPALPNIAGSSLPAWLGPILPQAYAASRPKPVIAK